MNISEKFAEAVKGNKKAQKILAKITAGTASYIDAHAYASEIANVCTDLLKEFSGDDIEDFITDYISDVLEAGQTEMNSMCYDLQAMINSQNMISVEPVKVKPDSDRVTNLITRIKEAQEAKTVQFLVEKPVVENIMKSAVNDNMQQNGARLDSYGVETYYTRSSGGGCCSWCQKKCGTYKYRMWPDDFWASHRNCSCVWTAHTASGKVKSKSTFSYSNHGTITRNQTDYL